jgi:hypothetical protein
VALYNFHGATITFSTSFFAQITSIRHTGISRPPIDTTHTGTTGARAFVPSNLYDPGEIAIEGFYDNTKSFVTPINGAAESVTITKLASGQNTGGTVVANGFLTSFEWGGPTEDSGEMATFSAVLKLTDDITFTAGS